MSRKEEIINHALDIFQHAGYHQVSMKDIANGLSIKRTTLYDYFKSKEEIVFLLIETMFESTPLSRTSGTMIDRINSLTSQMLNRVKNNLIIYRLLFTALPALDENMQEKISAWQKPFFDEVEDIFSRYDQEKKDELILIYRSLISTKISDYITSESLIHIEQDIKLITKIIRSTTNHD